MNAGADVAGRRARAVCRSRGRVSSEVIEGHHPSRLAHRRRPAPRALAPLLAAAVIAIARCGSDTDPEPASETPDLAAAEKAVRGELPDTPFWEGTRFEAVATSDSEICVDRIRPGPAGEGSGSTSHVVVSWPALALGDPMDGPCAMAEENADRAIEAANRFYIQMDDAAIALDDAVAAAQNGEPEAVRRLATLHRRIENRVNDHLLGGGESTFGANLLLSSAATAVDAARAGDLAQMATVRRDIAEARGRLAEGLSD